MKKFYEFKQESDSITDLYIFGDITSYSWFESDVGSYDMAMDLAEIDTDLCVHINSYGGEVSEGLAIYSLLKSYASKHEVTTYCDGFACSAASVIFMAGTKRIMPMSGLLLIHNAWTFASGDSNELRKQADDLEKITEPSLNIYESVSKLSREEIKSMMDREEWITAEEALSYGFATAIEQELDVQQSLNDKAMQRTVLRMKSLEKELETLKQDEVKDPWKAYFKGGK